MNLKAEGGKGREARRAACVSAVVWVYVCAFVCYRRDERAGVHVSVCVCVCVVCQ